MCGADNIINKNYVLSAAHATPVTLWPGSGAVSLVKRPLTNWEGGEWGGLSDEVEELGVDSDMERDKDADDEAEREEGDFVQTHHQTKIKMINRCDKNGKKF